MVQSSQYSSKKFCFYGTQNLNAKCTKVSNLSLSKPVQSNPHTYAYKVNTSEIIQKFHSPCITKLCPVSVSWMMLVCFLWCCRNKFKISVTYDSSTRWQQ